MFEKSPVFRKLCRLAGELQTASPEERPAIAERIRLLHRCSLGLMAFLEGLRSGGETPDNHDSAGR